MKTKLLIIISTLLFTNILYSLSPSKIQEGLDLGYSEWEIYSHLIKKGHSAEQIDEWFLQLKSINTLKDFAELSTDELIGFYDEKKGKRFKFDGFLEEFALAKNEADELIMAALNIVFK